jgi:hypothetical protein
MCPLLGGRNYVEGESFIIRNRISKSPLLRGLNMQFSIYFGSEQHKCPLFRGAH